MYIYQRQLAQKNKFSIGFACSKLLRICCILVTSLSAFHQTQPAVVEYNKAAGRIFAGGVQHFKCAALWARTVYMVSHVLADYGACQLLAMLTVSPVWVPACITNQHG
jgi:hypothetical protein